MKKYITSSENSGSIPNVDKIILQLEEMIKYAKDINNAIAKKDGVVRDVNELAYDVDDIVFDLRGVLNSMGEMAEWQKIFK